MVEDAVEKGELGGQPLYPPTPMIGHLTNEEIEALNDVFSRMELFEAEESARIRYVRLHPEFSDSYISTIHPSRNCTTICWPWPARRSSSHSVNYGGRAFCYT